MSNTDKTRNPPDTIYLQWWGADQSELDDCPDPVPHEVTWCDDKQFDTDVAYVRRDEYDKLVRTLIALSREEE